MKRITSVYDIDPNEWGGSNEGFTVETKALIQRMGGKGQLMRWLGTQIPRNVQTYVEPFFGSGKVFFTKPHRHRIEIINDFDVEVANFYAWARFAPAELTELINTIPTHEALMLGFREALGQQRLSGILRAAAFYVVLKTTYNAVFTTTLGKYSSSPHVLNTSRINKEDVALVAERLKGVDIRSTSFERILDQTVKSIPNGIFFYFDPPYDDTAGYEGAQGSLTFGWNHHVKLFEYCEQIHATGGRFIQTNSLTPRLVEMYGSNKGFFLKEIDVRYSVGISDESRKDYKELVISNFPLMEANKDGQSQLFGGR